MHGFLESFRLHFLATRLQVVVMLTYDYGTPPATGLSAFRLQRTVITEGGEGHVLTGCCPKRPTEWSGRLGSGETNYAGQIRIFCVATTSKNLGQRISSWDTLNRSKTHREALEQALAGL